MLLDRMRSDLLAARKAGNATEVSTIRTLIASIENAQAVDVELSVEPKHGLDHDIPRRQLSPGEVSSILRRESSEVVAAIERYRDLGLVDEVDELGARLAVIERYLDNDLS